MSHLRVVWLGEDGGGLTWLRQRMEQHSLGATESIELLRCDVPFQTAGISDSAPVVAVHLEAWMESGIDRFVVGCRNRLEYPVPLIDWLQRMFPEVPLAVAVDTYWEGSRRTGLDPESHVTLPWHRWWDGWVDWIEGSVPAWFGPFPQRASLPSWCAPSLAATPERSRDGLIVANCWQTGEAWRRAVLQVGGRAEQVSWSKFQAAGSASYSTVEWLLWDDTCDNPLQSDDLASRSAQIRLIRERYPDARLFCALSIPRWDEWTAMELAGAREVLTKPSTGTSLQRLVI